MLKLKTPVKLRELHNIKDTYDFTTETKNGNSMEISLIRDSVGFTGYRVNINSKSLIDFEADLRNCYQAQHEFYHLKGCTYSYFKKVDLSISIMIEDQFDASVNGFNTSKNVVKKSSTSVNVANVKRYRDMNQLLKILAMGGMKHGWHEKIQISRLTLGHTGGTMYWYKFRYLKTISLYLYFTSDIDEFNFCKKLKFASNVKSLFLRLTPRIKRERIGVMSWFTFSFKTRTRVPKIRENLLILMFSCVQHTEVTIYQNHTRCDTIYLANCLRKDKTVKNVEFSECHVLPLEQMINCNEKFSRELL